MSEISGWLWAWIFAGSPILGAMLAALAWLFIQTKFKAEVQVRSDAALAKLKGEIEKDNGNALARLRGEIESTNGAALEKLKADLHRDSEQDLERFRSKLDRDRTLHAVATDASAATRSAMSERRLNALDAIWRLTVEQRHHAFGPLQMLDTLDRTRLLAEPRPDAFFWARSDNPDAAAQASVEVMRSFRRQADGHRAFVDEQVWALFVGLHSVMLALLLKIRLRESLPLKFWVDDNQITSLLKRMTDEPDLAAATAKETGGLGIAVGLAETQLMYAVKRDFSEDKASEDALTRSRWIMKAVADGEAKTVELTGRIAGKATLTGSLSTQVVDAPSQLLGEAATAPSTK